MDDVVGGKVFECFTNLVGMLEGARLERVLAFTSVVAHSVLSRCKKGNMILRCEAAAGAE